MDDNAEQQRAASTEDDLDAPGASLFCTWDQGMDHLNKAASLLNAWAACPSQFDCINGADRQLMFIVAADLAQKAKKELSKLYPK